MKYFKYLILILILIVPVYVFGGGNAQIFSTDVSDTQLSAYYDLRERKSYIQVTNVCSDTRTIHVQIFQHDRNCDELDFEDTLTQNDTVVYDLDNLINNSGIEVPINLQDDSYGYLVITQDPDTVGECLIGNFRITDNIGYEYRTNMVGSGSGTLISSPDEDNDILIANFNTVDGAMFTDIVGYAYSDENTLPNFNLDQGFSFDIFVFDMNEEPLSCDRRNFACGNVMNYGVNEDYVNSRNGPLLCPGGGLANPNGGYISFENGANLDMDDTDSETDNVFVGYIGINNNNGTGTMDTWIMGESFPFTP